MTTETRDEAEDFLFNPDLLLDCSNCLKLDPGFAIRPLSASDYSRQYLQLLAQLTVVGEIDEQSFRSKFFSSMTPAGLTLCTGRFDEMRAAKMYYIIVIEDEEEGKVVAATTLFLEYKFIHSNSLVSRIFFQSSDLKRFDCREHGLRMLSWTSRCVAKDWANWW